MYESYGKELLASGTFDGKLFALPETAIDDGSQLLWLRRDWMEQLGVKEPKTLDCLLYTSSSITPPPQQPEPMPHPRLKLQPQGTEADVCVLS